MTGAVQEHSAAERRGPRDLDQASLRPGGGSLAASTADQPVCDSLSGRDPDGERGCDGHDLRPSPTDGTVRDILAVVAELRMGEDLRECCPEPDPPAG